MNCEIQHSQWLRRFYASWLLNDREPRLSGYVSYPEMQINTWLLGNRYQWHIPQSRGEGVSANLALEFQSHQYRFLDIGDLGRIYTLDSTLTFSFTPSMFDLESSHWLQPYLRDMALGVKSFSVWSKEKTRSEIQGDVLPGNFQDLGVGAFWEKGLIRSSYPQYASPRYQAHVLLHNEFAQSEQYFSIHLEAGLALWGGDEWSVKSFWRSSDQPYRTEPIGISFGYTRYLR